LKELGVQEWVLRRGLVERVTMPARRFLQHGEQILALAPVHSVSLRLARRDVGALAACPLLARLRGLDLSGNNLKEADVRRLLTPHLSGLQQLDLSRNPLGPGGVAALTASPHLAGLRSLALRSVGMDFEGARVLAGHVGYPRKYAKLTHLAGLLALDIRRNVIHDGVTVLAHSPHLARLTELSLSSVWGKSVEELHDSRYLKNLTVLRISGDFSEGIPGLLCCPFAKKLRVLELDETGARDRHAEAIADCRHLTRLERLSLGNNGIGDDGLRALASRARMPRLRRLVLDRNQIGSEGARALCDSTLVRELCLLDLSYNHLDDGAASALAACRHLTRLRGLDLARNQIGDVGAVALAGSPILQRLEALSLRNNALGEKGTAALDQAIREAGMPPSPIQDWQLDPDRARGEPLGETQ
jgi:Leucine-rich repeat (LRR) protein